MIEKLPWAFGGLMGSKAACLGASYSPGPIMLRSWTRPVVTL